MIAFTIDANVSLNKTHKAWVEKPIVRSAETMSVIDLDIVSTLKLMIATQFCIELFEP